ncbi:hypothetical protein [Intestinibacter sp.]
MILGIILINRKKSEQQRIVEEIPIRISINGIKGKSIITRLVTSILIEAGYKVVGKTAGSSEKMIYWCKNDETSYDASSKDELSVIQKAVELEAEALVYEGMDASPDSKKVFQFKKLDENVVVISNISKDYVDVNDPIVQAFADIIPYDGYLITINSSYTDYFKKIARERDTKVITADNLKIADEYLALFDYTISAENAALAIAVGQALGIDEKTCLRGMLNISQD